MRFSNRHEAGTQLAHALRRYAGREDVVVIGLPRGGVVVAAAVARILNLPLDITVPRKIGHEANPEYAIGAIAETGEAVWNETEQSAADPAYLRRTIQAELVEAARRLESYRTGRPPRDFKGQMVILVDDGVATGYTMGAAIKAAQTLGATSVIVAVPHGAHDSLEVLRHLADDVIVLDQPEPYLAVGAHYDDFPEVGDDEVIAIMRQPMAEKSPPTELEPGTIRGA